MRSTALAVSAVVAQAMLVPFTDAFVPNSLSVDRPLSISITRGSNGGIEKRHQFNLSMTSGNYLGMDDDEDEDDEDEDDDLVASTYSGATSPFTGLKLDPWDPNPLIKPRPSRYFKEGKETIPDDELVQKMSAEERKENLSVMRQIRKSDLPDLRMRKDHAGWVEANNDLKRRYERDPWFGAVSYTHLTLPTKA